MDKLSLNRANNGNEQTAGTKLDRKLDTVPDYLYHHYKNQPNREAVVFLNNDGSRNAVTFGQLYEKSCTLAKSFISLGVKKDEFVAVCLRSCPEWLYATFGAIMAGARPIGLSFTYIDGSDVVAMMEKLQTCSAIILDPGIDEDNWNIFTKLISELDEEGHVTSSLMPYMRYVICRTKPNTSIKVLTLAEMMTKEHQFINLPSLEPDDIVALFQTSGSTGFPKACAHTHSSIISAVSNYASTLLNTTSVVYNDRPFTWAGGFPWNVVSGETRVTRSGFGEPPKNIVGFLFNVIRKENCEQIVALPPLFNSLLDRQEEIDDEWLVKIIGSGGQPVPKRFAQCIGRLGQRFICVYAATEFLFGSSITVDDPDNFQEHSIGYPNKGVQMKIVDDNGETTPANIRGEIYIKSPCMFKGYYNDPEKTRACFTNDGWFKTDDIGFVTEDGQFFCEGRKSEMIISGGMNVAPSILETALCKCPGVARVVCVPVPDDVMYQVICACVVLEDGSDVTEKVLRDYCDDIHNDKPGLFTVLPTYYLFLKEFPETYSGKTGRKYLIKLAAEKFTSL